MIHIMSSKMSRNRHFAYEELEAATDGFSAANELGQGGFGIVFWGEIDESKLNHSHVSSRSDITSHSHSHSHRQQQLRPVAVKKLRAGSMQGKKEFEAEVEIIGRIHHRHLVSLVGYCIFHEERLLVYDFVPNKTLEYHLHISSNLH
jgi:hypothetical protein